MSERSPRKLTYISMFSGIEAVSVAWEPLGFEPIAFAEIDPFPSAVLKKHYPHVPNLGDITKVNWRKYHGKVDIVVGGPPCQAFSVAGLRKALDDPRGVLVLEYLRACDQIKPEWIILENVPGLLSADGGRAFGSLLGALEKLGYHATWRVLDAQFFGVGQRRRRVFVVAHARDWRCAAAVLFERKSLFGDFGSSKEARAHFAAAAQERARETSNAGRIGEAISFSYGNSAQSRSMGEAEGVTPTIRSAGGGNSVPVICESEKTGLYSISGNIIGWKAVNGGNHTGIAVGDAPMYTLTAIDRHAVCRADEGACFNPWATQSDRVFPENSVFSSLVGGGKGSRGYAGGCILDSVSSNTDVKTLAFDTTQVTNAQNRSNPQWDDPCHTLPAAGKAPSICVEASDSKKCAQNSRNELCCERGDRTVAGTIFSPQGIEQQASSKSSFGIRRLTPVECERLQGFPDNWTRIAWNGKPEEVCPNGRRYKAVGNSMAVPVMQWIGKGLMLVDNESGRASVE